MFSFESSARIDLARSLTQAGAPKVSQAVGEIESLVQQYHSRFIAEEVFPDMKFIVEHGNFWCLPTLPCVRRH